MTRSSYIDALRGYAILFVLVGHCIFLVGDLPSSITNSVFAYGGRGVQLFFIVSAITLMNSWKVRRDGIARFYLRRMFRIAPMWWIAVVYWLSRMGTEPRYFAPDGVGEADIVFNMTLLHGLSPYSLMSIVPGGWSIGAEVLFYLMFPFVTAWCSNITRSFVLLGVTLVLRAASLHAISVFAVQPDVIKNAFLEYSIVSQAPVFAVGICTFYIIRRVTVSPQKATILFFLALAAVSVSPYAPVVGPTPLAFALCWAVASFGLANNGAAFVVNKTTVLIGKISYSAYFWHFIFLDNPVDLPKLSGGLPVLLIVLLKTLAFTIPCSLLTYKYVEIPLIRVGSITASRLMGGMSWNRRSGGV